MKRRIGFALAWAPVAVWPGRDARARALLRLAHVDEIKALMSGRDFRTGLV